jgi:hypothetical protein
MLTSQDLEAIRKRAEVASPGKWTADDYTEGHEHKGMHVESDATRGTMSALASYVEPADAQFIAHARTDVPALLDEVHSLKHLLMRACGEIFGGVVMRPFMIEELRKHHVVEEDTP